jgi:hypothetical protein
MLNFSAEVKKWNGLEVPMGIGRMRAQKLVGAK